MSESLREILATHDLSEEEIDLIDDLFEAWVGKKKYKVAFVKDCFRLLKAARKEKV